MIELPVIVTGPSEATVTAALVAAGILAPREGGIFPADQTTVYSPMPPALSGEASCLVRFQAVDQATADAVLAVIGADNINRASAPLRMVAGALQPKADAWPRWAIKFALTIDTTRTAWEDAVTALATKADATNAEKLLPDRWAENDWLTLDEPWVNRIINQMRTAAGWTPAQRNQFVNRIKTRATAQVAAAND